MWGMLQAVQSQKCLGICYDLLYVDSCASSMLACLGSDLLLAAQAADMEICIIKRQSMDRRCDVLIRAH